MLQQILTDMYIDPDILEALNEEQKKILFLKMREEQVRRWKEREEKDEEESSKEKPRIKKASYKKVSWQLGRDGDVHVCIIGEADDLTSPSLILSELREQNETSFSKTDRFQSSGFLRSSLDAQISQPNHIKPGIELMLKSTEEINHPSNHSEKDDTGFSDLQTPESFVMDRSLSIAERLNQRVLQRSTKKQLPIKETLCSQVANTKGKEVVHEQEIISLYGGRVAQLRRNFNPQNAKIPSLCAKPPIPTKPAHLLTAASV